MTRTGAAPASIRAVLRMLSDGDYVANHSLIDSDGGPGAVRFDLWRIADHEVIEHWADEDGWAPYTANGHTQIDGTSAVDRKRGYRRPAGSPPPQCRASSATVTPRRSMTTWPAKLRCSTTLVSATAPAAWFQHLAKRGNRAPHSSR
jgi:hypothetical protein